MRKFVLTLVITIIIMSSHAYTQTLHGTYYIDKEKSTKGITVFNKMSKAELPPTKSGVGLMAHYWTFNDPVLIKGWMNYTLNNGVFYCPWDKQDSKRYSYKIDKENNSILIWCRKKDMNKQMKPNQAYQIIEYNPLKLKSVQK